MARGRKRKHSVLHTQPDSTSIVAHAGIVSTHFQQIGCATAQGSVFRFRLATFPICSEIRSFTSKPPTLTHQSGDHIRIERDGTAEFEGFPANGRHRRIVGTEMEGGDEDLDPLV